MGREFVTTLVVLLDFLLIDLANLSELVLVVGVLDGRAVLSGNGGRWFVVGASFGKAK